VNVLSLALGPVSLARQVVSDVASLAAFARRFEPWQDEILLRADRILAAADDLQELGADARRDMARLIEVGEKNADTGDEMVELARANVEGNRETNRTMGSLDDRMAELIRFTAALEKELPGLVASLATIESLDESASALSDAAPPVQAAAERVERIAGRIPGMRGSTIR
jgi:methyl-accepting chemotaxis protein